MRNDREVIEYVAPDGTMVVWLISQPDAPQGPGVRRWALKSCATGAWEASATDERVPERAASWLGRRSSLVAARAMALGGHGHLNRPGTEVTRRVPVSWPAMIRVLGGYAA